MIISEKITPKLLYLPDSSELNMIFDGLKIVRDGLQDYIKDADELPSERIVHLDNVAMAQQLGGYKDSMEEGVIMSLINIQEEMTLKNSSHYRMENGRTVYQNPPVNLNLFVLFSVLNKDYETALKLLSRTIEFFQWKKEFLFAPHKSEELQNIRLLPELYTLTFDQLNSLWSSLGGRQVPFIMYRIRLITLDAQKPYAESEPVKEIVYE